MKPTVYVAGPYRSASKEGIDLNIQAARHVGLLCCRKGWAAVIPHANYATLDHCAPDLGDQFWLDATLELLKRCDAVVLCPGWERSSGTRDEITEAQMRGIPVYHAEHLLPDAAEFIDSRSSEPGKVMAGVRL
jgi:nucleoside 2-deoxyribosyltransferase